VKFFRGFLFALLFDCLALLIILAIIGALRR